MRRQIKTMNKKLLSLHLFCHDANVTYYDGNKCHYIKIERLKQVKKFSYPGHEKHGAFHADTLKKVLAFLNIDWDNLTEICMTIGGVSNDEVVGQVMQVQQPFKATRIDHHYAHKLSADWLFGDHDKALVIDGCGDNSNHTSMYDCIPEAGNVKFIDDRDPYPMSIGWWYAKMSDKFCPGAEKEENWKDGAFVDNAGKLMGLASYGNRIKGYYEWLRKRPYDDFCIDAFNFERVRKFGYEIEGKRKPELQTAYGYVQDTVMGITPHHVDWLYTAQEVLFEKIINYVLDSYNEKDEFTYTGGVAHNVNLNALMQQVFPNMKIPPYVGDEGLSLGGMYYLLLKHQIKADIPKYQADVEILPQPKFVTIAKMAEEISRGLIVANHQMGAEIGPRALGNRSIFYRPDMANAPKLFNIRGIKKREWWRPYGISLLQEDANRFLTTPVPSPYMLHTSTLTEEGKKALSGVVHVDGTVRYQTVENDWYALMLMQLKRLTGSSAVVNTSLNSFGKPLSHTIEDTKKFAEEAKPDLTFIGDDIYAQV